ncbi:hypothetical protein Godav_010877, partial [Gossypium davidsonii]|nr:hypothetical protein [Gossypium davidsonii]
MTSEIQHVKLQRMGKENVRNYHQMKSEHANACMNAVATPTETENRGRKIKNAVLGLDHRRGIKQMLVESPSLTAVNTLNGQAKGVRSSLVQIIRQHIKRDWNIK